MKMDFGNKTFHGILLWCLCVGPALAVNISYDARVGVEWSDNITRVEDSNIQQVTTVYDLSGTLNHQAKAYSLNLRPSVIYRDYQGGQFTDQTFATLYGSFLVRIRPGTFDWNFENFLTQTLVDQQAVPTPFGLQDTNVFFTGPDIRFNFGQAKTLTVSVRYANFYYSQTDTDNDRIGVRFRFENDTGFVTTHGISIDAANIRYENTTINENYKRDDVYYLYSRRGVRVSSVVELGFTRISQQKHTDFQDYMGLFRLSYEINRHSNAEFEVHSWFTDTSRNFLESRAYSEGIRRFSSAISGYVFREDYSYLRYRWEGDYLSFDLEMSGGLQDYMGSDDYLDRKLSAAYAGITKDLTRRINMTFRSRFVRANYFNQNIVNRDRYLTLGLGYRVRRNILLNFNYSNNSRIVENQRGGYEENVVYLNLAYLRH